MSKILPSHTAIFASFGLRTLTLSLFSVICLGLAPASAALVRYNLQNDVLTGEESLGLELDTVDDPGDPNSPSTATFGGITFVATATTNFGDGTAVVNAGGAGSGVNTGGGGASIGDAAVGIDAGEVLTLTITFDPGLYTVSLAEIDFGSIGDNTDSGTVSIAGGSSITVYDGVDTTGMPYTFTGFDIFEPTSPISLSSGDTLVFSNLSNGDFHIDSLDLDVVPVPEPSSVAILGLGGLAFILRRRR